MKRQLLTMATLVTLFGGSVLALPPSREAAARVAQQRALASYGIDVNVELDEKGVPTYVMGQLSARVEIDAVQAAEAALAIHGASFRRGPSDTFEVRTQSADELGMTHVRMSQSYKGVHVVGGELIVHMTRDAVSGINGRFVADLDLDVRAELSDAQAATYAQDRILTEGGVNLEIVAVGDAVIYAGDLERAPRLAIPVQVSYVGVEGVEIDDLFIDAKTGVLLGKNPRVHRAKSRRIYNANQACVQTGAELPGTLMFSEGGSSADTGAMAAYNNTGITYDYYKAVFNRDSYNNAGAILTSTVHAQFSTGTSCSKNNAAWFDSLSQMAYGDGDGTSFTNLAGSLDVTAHELTHAVTSRTSNLAYQKESGALNEGASDILGEATAFWAGAGDWKIGAEVYTPGTAGDALRYMANPTADGYSPDYYPERLYPGTCSPSNSNDQCGVHGNSGIANLWFYLLSQGGTHPRGKTTVAVTGIGITTAQQIFYRALTTLMTSTTNFQGARTATAQAAADLYGGTCTATWQSVHKAWDAVGVPGTWSCGGPTTYSISGSAGTNGATVSTGSASATSDSSNNYTISNLAAGTYTVTPTKSGCTFSPASRSVTVGPNSTGQNFTATCTSGDTQLTSGVTLSGQSVALQQWKYYYITVPAGATNLTFTTSGATTDLDIYTQVTNKPTLSSYICRPYGSTGNETCSATNPAAGTWWLGVYGYAAGNFSVIGTVTTAAATYTISGNAGTTGATVSRGAASVTSDSSSNFSFTGVAAGTYTITPSKSGCTFSPATRSVTVGPNASGVNFTATCGSNPQQLLVNPGFESGATTWVGTSGVITNSTSRTPRTGSYYAWLNGNGTTTTETLYQTVTIPAAATTATLSFYLKVDTAETTTSTQYDKLQIQIRNSSGTVLATLATYSNLNKGTTYVQKSFNVAAYKGQTIRVHFNGTEDSSLQTSFLVDDTALNTQ